MIIVMSHVGNSLWKKEWPRVGMNWKIRPPRQFAPLGPRDCLRGRIFQNTPPIGSALLQCFAKILKFRGLLGPCDLKGYFKMIIVLHGGYAQMITIIHGGGLSGPLKVIT